MLPSFAKYDTIILFNKYYVYPAAPQASAFFRDSRLNY